ncbi:MAG: DNA mismatch repair protein MutS [Candidatus Binatus sp.]|uniref:DNA mismatch repair protein MutS n=1 Tax=Candidatus Binatus sp. TaxID=2811406 RepID=UPI0027259D7D|nr:DNA mismatch repair protein MutS [Candidatus Binatus sp.]MDO8431410.1 DNA mismatch repair protein MutS [Candidatus Binatus sp.]
MAQYLGVKQRVPDAILFFRLGDFYEMFFEDAEVGARVLDIQLTSRSKDGVPLCGVPYHSAEPYIAKLLKAGHKVAICEQGPPDGKSGKLMPRQIVRVITPGTVGEEMVLTAAEKSYLVAIARVEAGFAPAANTGYALAANTAYALAALDVSTGEFLATQIRNSAALCEEIARIAPREMIVAENDGALAATLKDIDCALTSLDVAAFSAERSSSAFAARFGDAAADLDPSIACAAGLALLYVEDTFGRDLAHIAIPRLYQTAEYMLVDETTRRHLELVASSDGARKGSLLSILDETMTAIGARTLANWIVYPLLSLEQINGRHDAVEELFDADLGGATADALKRIGDLERLAGRIGSMRASPRDCRRLGEALDAVAMLKNAIAAFKRGQLRALGERIAPMPALVAQIESTLSDEPPINPRDGNVIRPGLSAEVDELRGLATDARGAVAKLEASERERSGIPSLKVRYNNVFGYYIEITKSHLERAPADYERKQTLAGAERFTTPALKEFERKILSAESGLKELELQLFTKLLRDLQAHSAAILETARAVGEFDAIMSLAKVARRRGYVRPAINTSLRIRVRDGRHPVLEAGMRTGEFVPNDLEADPETRQLLLITGPNMAGKSTYLRQVALIAIMAQCGSFVPAAEATIGLIDRVLTRIGARDELRRGESTFMVEMSETARLLDGLTERSLLLLDEVGRGTSTFDGLAIAWAVAEYLHDQTRAKVLFATHFHELTDLARERPRVKNLSMAVREWAGEVLFLRRVIEQPASRSYGIEVARLAGLPQSIIARAREILVNLESSELDEAGMPRLARNRRAEKPAPQMGLFTPRESRVIDELRALEVETLTPIEALNALARIVARLNDQP